MLYHGVYPVFVFDGATPTLKRHTTAARRQAHVNKAMQVRRTAEKLLKNSMKARLLREEEITKSLRSDSDDLMLDYQLARDQTEKIGIDDVENTQLDSAAHQSGLQGQHASGNSFYDRKLSANAKHGLCEDDEIEIPVLDNIDPEVLAKLPPSVQFDIMLKMREQRVVENRSNFQKLSASMTDFSELQLGTYLKSNRLKRKVERASREGTARSPCGRDAVSSDLEAKASDQVRNADDDLKPIKRIASIQHRKFLLSKPNVSGTRKDVFEFPRTRDLACLSRAAAEPVQCSWENNYFNDGRHFANDPIYSMKVPPYPYVAANTVQTAHTASNVTDMQESPLNKQDNNQGLAGPDLQITFKAEYVAEGIDPIFGDVKERPDPLSLPSSSVSNETLDDADDWESVEVDKDAESHKSIFHFDLEKEIPVYTFPRNEGMTARSADISQVNLRRIQDRQDHVSGRTFQVRSACKREDAAKAVRRRIGNNDTSDEETKWFPQLRESNSSEQPIKYAAQEQNYLADNTDVSDVMAVPYQRRYDDNVNISANFDPGPASNSKQMRSLENEGHRAVTSKHMVSSTHTVTANTLSMFLHFPSGVKAIICRSMELDHFETEVYRALDQCPVDVVLEKCLEKEDMSLEYRSFRVDIHAPIKSCLPLILAAFERFFRTTYSRGGETPQRSKNVILLSAMDAVSDFEALNHRKVLGAMLDDTYAEIERLRSEGKSAARGADTPTEEMYRQIQDLLTLFGVPYLIAPQEAEAQCAWMNAEGLVDAVITEDSDAFLFGANTIYRNVFNSKKYVEVYSAERIQQDIGVDRAKLAELALLLGSDYTEGVTGVGIVNALEIASVFSGFDGLKTFRSWVEDGDLPAQADSGIHCSSSGLNQLNQRNKHNIEAVCNDLVKDKNIDSTNCSDATISRDRETFEKKHQAAKRSWILPDSFPSVAVLEAYAKPSIDSSKAQLEWGKPEFALLRDFCRESFNWGRGKTDELLLPVIQIWEKAEQQTSIHDFFSVSAEQFGSDVPVAKYRSTRIQNAIAGLKFASPG